MNGLERITVHLPQAGMGSDLDPSLFTIDALGIPSFPYYSY